MSFVPDPALLIAYLIGVIVIAITPGPDMTFFLGKTIAKGVPYGLAAMVGASCGIMVHSMLVAFGLSALIVASPNLFFAIKVAGALYLLWLAVDALRKGSTFRFEKASTRQTSLKAVWLQGVAINLLNPKIILFFMTFLPQFVSASDPDARGKLLFLGAVFVIIAFVIVVPMILAAGKLTGWLKNNPKATRVIDYVFASVFGAFAVRILFTERG
jgi:threonine/homoserine/homoserine lactone efflux protein